MSLLGKIANKEVLNFLRTLTIKNTYFADRLSKNLIEPQIAEFVPETCNPYVINLTGEYVLRETPEPCKVINPATGLEEIQTYENYASQLIYTRDGYRTRKIENFRLYHENAFNEMMWVTSLDTQQKIPFTLENFYSDYALAAGRSANSIHQKTLEAYRLPSRYFELLCQKYPKQVDLIKAIVYRVPTNKIYSINGSGEEIRRELSEKRRTVVSEAKNFSLLGYDSSLLNNSEKDNIVQFVKSFLDIVSKRWNVKEYAYEENYATVLWATMWSVLPLAIICKRYANIKTPNASLNHMWDYLTSKGLENYRGYLTEEQTQFLYKNIEYLNQHRGQQKTMNIMIDRLLDDFGFTIKSKTVVLDTTNSLTQSEKPSNPESQCQTCARNGVTCNKNIRTHFCSDWLGTKSLCKAEPVVITEDFSGASEKKIIRALVSQYGYTEEKALEKYKRSFIWKDDDIEKIKNDLNRDQLVDLTGSTQSLEEIISVENMSGNEPVVNEDVVDEQVISLQHMNGTNAPTKLLELSPRQYNVKFAELFNRFITETFLKFAPHLNTETGKLIKKINMSYKFTTTKSATVFLFDYGEMLAATYFGFIREHLIDVIIDQIKEDGHGQPLFEDVLDKDGNRIVIDHDKYNRPVYAQRPVEWVRQRLTDFFNQIDYKFPIPNKARLSTAFKFGRPVFQKELIESWNKNDDSNDNYLNYVTNKDENTRIVMVRNMIYAVTSVETSDDWAWDNFSTKLKILGCFTFTVVNGESSPEYHENNNEIPLIPQFFRWYHTHLASDDPMIEKFKCAYADRVNEQSGEHRILDGSAEASEIFTSDNDISIQNSEVLYDSSKSKYYLQFDMDKFVDIGHDGDFIDKWIDVTGTIPTQEYLANYIDTMFKILENIYIYAGGSGSIRTHQACRVILNRVLTSGEIAFDLVATRKSRTASDGSSCVYFSDWFKENRDVGSLLEVLDKSSDLKTIWNEFNSRATSALLEGCKIPFAINTSSSAQYEKLKELVLSLSSYKITLLDLQTSDQVCNETAAISEDAMVTEIKAYDQVFFDPIGDSVYSPRVGGYLENEGFVFVPTHDYSYDETKKYYVPSYGKSELIPNLDIVQFKEYQPYSKTLDKWVRIGKTYYKQDVDVFIKRSDFIRIKKSDVTQPLPEDVLVEKVTEEDVEFEVVYSIPSYTYEKDENGKELEFGKCYEEINIYSLLGLENGTPVKIFRAGCRWFYCIGEEYPTEILYPCGKDDTGVIVTNDTFIENEFYSKTEEKVFAAPVYRKKIESSEIVWSDPIKSSTLEYWLGPTVSNISILETNKEQGLLSEEVINNEE